MNFLVFCESTRWKPLTYLKFILRKHLQDRIIQLRDEIWAHKTIFFYWSTFTKPEWAVMYMCASGIDFAQVSKISH